MTIEETHTAWRPDKCPVTMRPFFCWVEHPTKGLVPTYGGAYNSYTIPEACINGPSEWYDLELTCENYDHDEGCWTEIFEVVSERLIQEETLIDLGVWNDANTEL